MAGEDEVLVIINKPQAPATETKKKKTLKKNIDKKK